VRQAKLARSSRWKSVKSCYGKSAAEVGKDIPPEPHSTPLTEREIAAVADYVLAVFAGK
jgi:hypothetical protein